MTYYLSKETDVNDQFVYSKKEGISNYRGIDLFDIKNSPLSHAVENTDVEIVELLLLNVKTDSNTFSEYKSEYSIKETNVESKNVKDKNKWPLFDSVQKITRKL